MKLKLDENLGNSARLALHAAGHDVSTVPLQDLQSASDENLIARCALEGRALISLDLDFANPLRFEPSRYAGIAVLRQPGRPDRRTIDGLIRTLIGALAEEPLSGELWIVEPGRIRVHQSD